jgi:hypothetical protein
MRSFLLWLSKVSTLSTIALVSMVGCFILAVADASLRGEFFKLAAANLGGYIALQRPSGDDDDPLKDD